MSPRSYLGSKMSTVLRSVSAADLGLANMARMPAAMAPLALVLAEGHSRRALAVGSLLVGAFTMGEIFFSARLARLGDRLETRRALTSLMVPLTVLWALFGLLAPHFSRGIVFVALLVMAVPIGGLGAGLFGIARHLIVGGHRPGPGKLTMERLVALDTSLMEVFFFVAPMLVSASIVVGGAAFAAFSVAFVGAAGLGLLGALPGRSLEQAPAEPEVNPERSKVEGSLWLSRERAWIFVASSAMGIAEGGFIVAVPSILVEKHLALGYSGLIVGLLSVGSVIGGLAVAKRPGLINRISIRRRLALLLLGLAVGVSLVSMLPSVAAMAVGTLLAGSFVAPLNTTRVLAIQSLASKAQKAEGFGALYGSYSIGFAAVGLALGILGTTFSAAAILVAMTSLSIATAAYLIAVRPYRGVSALWLHRTA
ncbi:MAG: hypothetical protein M0Z34_00655 [Nitrospiraceae bacterium]|nr:hypothetical protein [Nitrospiraceae bacterium]